MIEGKGLCEASAELDMTGGGATMDVSMFSYTTRMDLESCDPPRRETCKFTSPLVLSPLRIGCGPLYACQSFLELRESAEGLRVYNGMDIIYAFKTCQIDAGAVFGLVSTFAALLLCLGCYRKRLVRLRDETVNPKLEVVYRQSTQHRPKHVAIQPAGSRQVAEIPHAFKEVLKC